MRHQTEISPVARFQEESHARHKPEHGVLVLRVRQADGDEKNAGDNGEGVNRDFFAPDTEVWVDEVADHTSQGAEDHVQEAEHGGPVAGAGLSEGREILEVVCAEDAVDGEFAAKGAEVGAALDEGLRREDDWEGLAEGGFDDDFAAGGVEHLLLVDLGFAGEPSRLLGLDGFKAKFLLGAVGWAAGACGGFVGELAGNVDDDA